MESRRETVPIRVKNNNSEVEKEFDKNLTLNEVEQKFCKVLKEKMADRGTSITNLTKTLEEIVKENPLKKLTFTLIDKSKGIINDLDKSEVNMNNLGNTCYISTYLQSMFKIILPKALEKLNKERKLKGEKPIENPEDLKNFGIENQFYNDIIDTAIEVINIQKFGNGGVDKNGNTKVSPTNVCNTEKQNSKEDIYLHQGLACEIKINEALYKFAIEAKKKNEKDKEELDGLLSKINPPKKKFKNSSIQNKELIKIFEITKPTIVSEVMKIKIDNKFYLNIVLNFDENTMADENLNIITLLENCQQLKKDNFTKKRIQETSEIIYMIVDRISSGEEIDKNFIILENIYLDKNIGFFTKKPSLNSILYELKFIIYHLYFGRPNYGHYIAYSKFRGEWHYFNDLDIGYAKKEDPPLLNFVKNTYPVCFFYVKNEENNKDLENCNII